MVRAQSTHGSQAKAEWFLLQRVRARLLSQLTPGVDFVVPQLALIADLIFSRCGGASARYGSVLIMPLVSGLLLGADGVVVTAAAMNLVIAAMVAIVISAKKLLPAGHRTARAAGAALLAGALLRIVV